MVHIGCKQALVQYVTLPPFHSAVAVTAPLIVA
jgi:hypothetical protein